MKSRPLRTNLSCPYSFTERVSAAKPNTTFGRPDRAEVCRELAREPSILDPRHADEGERQRAEDQIEEPAAVRRDGVVVALRYSRRDELDLAQREAEASVLRLAVPRLRLGVREEDLRRARLEQERAERRGIDLGEALAREDERRVALAEHPEPLLDLRREDRDAEERPRLFENDEGRRTGQATSAIELLPLNGGGWVGVTAGLDGSGHTAPHPNPLRKGEGVSRRMRQGR